MPNDPTNSVLTPVETLLVEVVDFIHPPKERTLFSLGGRGHYENPASDLLAFFLNPAAEHGFQSLFLKAFFDCMNVDSERMIFEGVKVDREVQTREGTFIDVLVDAPDWLLIIENKIYHAQVNPFDSYERHVRGIRETTHLAILSPSGQSTAAGWTGVSYKNFCQSLRKRLADVMFAVPYSKWLVFAREFILHLENELYNSPMTTLQATFVENNEQQIAEVQKLAIEYRVFLRGLLKEALEENVPGHSFEPKDEYWKDDGWATRCKSNQWGSSNVAFWRANGKFMVTVYLVDLSEDQRAKARVDLREIKFLQDKTWMMWQTEPGFDSRYDGIKELCRLAGIVAGLLQAPPAPVGAPSDTPAQ